MATIKSYTDLEQSKKLTEILALESADMCYPLPCEDEDKPLLEQGGFGSIPCWSLAALLNILPNYQMQTQDDGIGILCSCNGNFNIVTADNPVDACVDMIESLHELKIL